MTDQPSDLVLRAAKHVDRARSTAGLLEVLSWLMVALSVLAIVGAVTAGEPDLVIVTVVAAIATGGTLYGVLQAIALILHMRVDEIVIEGED